MISSFAIGVITYNSSPSLFLRLQEALNDGYHIYIYDNSPENKIVREFVKRNTKSSPQIVYLTCGKNAGLGFGLASLCAQVYYDSFSAMLFFDQDTIFNNDTLRFISTFYNENTVLDKAYSAIVFNSKDAGNMNSPGGAVRDVRLAINSGSLYFLKNLKKMNWHNMNYFVDCVDYDFCLSSNNFGFKIGEYTKAPGFDHNSEQGDQRYEFLGAEYSIRVYSFARTWDSIFATLKLLVKSITTGNYVFFYEISKAIFKYLITQSYARVSNAVKFSKTAARN